MKQYKYYLFDWDGCLADTLTAALDAYIALGKSYGKELSHEQIMQAWGDWDKSVALMGAEKDDYVKRYDEHVRENIENVMVFDSAKQALKQIKGESDTKVAVVSSSMHEWIVRMAENNEVLGYLDYIVGADDVQNTKPDPEPVFKALAQLAGVEESEIDEQIKSQAVMIGDTEKDILAGQAAGVDTILFEPEQNLKFYKSSYSKYKPTFVIEDHRDLLVENYLT
ncbi:MAG: HAD family hydrolase [Candidatus Dojkabacteria bacterium]